MKTLYYFCHYFPYGQREPLVETEVFQLAPHFEKIILIPFFKEDGERNIPENAKIHWFNKSTRTLFSGNKACSTFDVSQKLLKSVPEISPFDPWKFKFTRKWRVARLHAERLLNDLDFDENTVLYSPWMNIWGATLSILKEQQKEKSLILPLYFRANGADLYPERMGQVPQKLQAISMEAATRIFPVSNHGQRTLQQIFPQHAWKIETAYHGIPSIHANYQPSSKKRWLTVSTLQPVKRLERVVEILSKMRENIVWTHIGGEGDALKELVSCCKSLPENIEIDFRGRLRQPEIINLLQKESFDLFLNVSDSEGLPLSAVEAAHAGIPLLLSDVGGSKEIPNAQVLPVSPFIPEVWISKIHNLHNPTLEDRNVLQMGAQNRFGLENYLAFSQKLQFNLEGTVVIMDDNLPGFSIAKALIDAGIPHSKITVIRQRKGRMQPINIADFNPDYHPQPWILFPLNERHWQEAKKWKDKDPHGIRLTFDPQTEDVSLHKHLQRERVQNAGIASVPFQLVRDFDPKKFPFPWVVKPSNKMEKGRKTERFYLIFHEKDWHTHSVHFQPTDLVEEWKNKATVAAVVGFRGENGVEQFSAFRRRCYPDDYTIFSTVEVLENEEILRLASQILEQLPVKGLFELEFLETEQGFQFLELNNRATTWIEAWRWAGKNVIFQTLSWALEQPTNENTLSSGSGWLVHRKNEWSNLRYKPTQLSWLIKLYLKGKKVLWV